MGAYYNRLSEVIILSTHYICFYGAIKIIPKLSSDTLLICFTAFYLSRLMTKPTKWHVRPAKTQISLGIRPVWSESSLSTWRKLGFLATHWAHSEDSDQTGRMPRLIWVFVGRTVVLLVLSWGGSFYLFSALSEVIRTYRCQPILQLRKSKLLPSFT